MRIELLLPVAFALMGLIPSASAEDLLSQKETDSVVKKFQNDYAVSFDHRDAKSMVALFTSNATMQNEWGDITQGRANIESLVQRLMKKLPDKATLEDTALVSQCVAPGVIVSQGISRRLIPDAEAQQMFFTRVLVRLNGQWLLNATQIARPSNIPKPVVAPTADSH